MSEGGATIIDGKETAKTIRNELKGEIEKLNFKPGLAVLLVGDRTDSKTYVRMKMKACAEIGIESFQTNLPDTATQEDILKSIQEMNQDPKIHAILVQLPLPEHINEDIVSENSFSISGINPLL